MKISLFKCSGKRERINKAIKAAKNSKANPKVIMITTRCNLIINNVLPKRFRVPGKKYRILSVVG